MSSNSVLYLLLVLTNVNVSHFTTLKIRTIESEIGFPSISLRIREPPRKWTYIPWLLSAQQVALSLLFVMEQRGRRSGKDFIQTLANFAPSPVKMIQWHARKKSVEPKKVFCMILDFCWCHHRFKNTWKRWLYGSNIAKKRLNELELATNLLEPVSFAKLFLTNFSCRYQQKYI